MDMASKTVAYLLGNIYPKKSHQPGALPKSAQQTIFPILKGMAQLFLQSDVEKFNIKAATLLNPTQIWQQEAKKRKYFLFLAPSTGVLLSEPK